MQEMKFSSKEKAIFAGIMALIREGINPYTIKVSDIAKKADVGKGTIYDYFKSKEEAISKALLHHLGRGLEETLKAVEGKDGFRDKYYVILWILARQADENKEQCKMFSPLGELSDFYEHLADYQEYLQANDRWVKRIFEDVFEAGIREGLIRSLEDEEESYREMAIIGALAAFAHSLYHPVTRLPAETAMAASYRILVKALS